MIADGLAPCGQAGAPPIPASTLVIIGASGDLTHRLLTPALLQLVDWKLLPDRFRLVAFGHREQSVEDYRERLLATPFAAKKPAEARAWLRPRIAYMNGDFERPESFIKLKQVIEACSERTGSHDVVFYLAVAPQFILTVVRQLHEAGLLAEQEHASRRVIIEKPFGHDLASAIKLNADLHTFLREDQIFRIDHFLGKETVRNILALRFANAVFEPMWTRNHVAQVEITAAETVGVETRGRFYEQVGALRDMVPNHLFEILSLVAMEPPNSFAARDIDRAKVQLMDAVRPVTQDCVVRGQYAAGAVEGRDLRAYRDEPDVSSQSQTETYVALRLHIDNWRWNGVPFLLRTGKALTQRSTQIILRFRPVPNAPTRGPRPNSLLIGISPKEEVSLDITAKCPGPEMRFGSVPLQFDYGAHFNAPPQTGYETLIYDALIGDRTPFRSQTYVESSWRVVDPLLHDWPQANVHPYAAGTYGPTAADHLAPEGWHDRGAP
jgi:glucose-6-phosphate 1-dehydrogenase